MSYADNPEYELQSRALRRADRSQPRDTRTRYWGCQGRYARHALERNATRRRPAVCH